MNNAAAWTSGLTEGAVDRRRWAVRRSLVLSSIILAVTIGVTVWVYVYGKEALRAQMGLQPGAETLALLARIDRILLGIIVIAAVGGASCLVPLFTAVTRWRQRVISQLEARAEDWQYTAATLETQLSEAKRAKDSLLANHAELEARLKQANAINVGLQAELDKRNRAERALAQRRQELESSKSVLELHVQARTQELENLQRRYEMILNSAGEGICGLDLEGKATFLNPAVAHLTGRPLAELIGKTEAEIFFGNNGEQTQAKPAQNRGEQVFYRQDGTPFPVEFIKTPIDENGRVVGSVLVFKDITERKRVEETLSQRAAELARSNSELEQFAFVASHDLQEPLRKIQAFGDRLKVKCAALEGGEVRDYLERMQNAAARMRTLIDDLLTFSRVIRSSEPFVAVDLEQVVKEVLSDLEVRIEKSSARVEYGVLPTIEADPMQMRQLLLNLLSNALKFQPAGSSPVVFIQARTFNALSGEPLCELTVQDNGIGFDEKYLDRIFAVFQRLHGRSEYEGTGVGLAVCRRIVDRHHGAIMARSKPGEGATFIVTLPIRQNRPEEAL
jgi:PAS domain S-box-containing protein